MAHAVTLQIRLVRHLGKKVTVIFGTHEFALVGTLVDVGTDYLELMTMTKEVEQVRTYLIPVTSIRSILIQKEDADVDNA